MQREIRRAGREPRPQPELPHARAADPGAAQVEVYAAVGPRERTRHVRVEPGVEDSGRCRDVKPRRIEPADLAVQPVGGGLAPVEPGAAVQRQTAAVEARRQVGGDQIVLASGLRVELQRSRRRD